jgi:biopolymer transport protein ExbD
MITPPSQRRKRRPDPKLNLTSIMDAIFIFNFFLLMSANFIKVHEIASPIPIVSEEEPKDDKKPLALTLIIKEEAIDIMTGVPSTLYKSIPKLADLSYDLVELHNNLIKIKEANPTENSAILNPEIDLEYNEIIKIMDAARLIYKTDEAIYVKGADGLDKKTETLFNNVIFGNIGS